MDQYEGWADRKQDGVWVNFDKIFREIFAKILFLLLTLNDKITNSSKTNYE